MPTQEEIDSFVNKQWLDRRGNVDELLAANASIGLETNKLLSYLITTLGGTPPQTTCGVLKENCIVGYEGIALGTAEANSPVSVAIGGATYSCLSKDNINRYEKVVIVGGTVSEPYVTPIRRANVIDTNTVYEPRSTFIHRVASTVAAPVKAGAGYTTGVPEHHLIDLRRGVSTEWDESKYLVIYALGSDEHEDSFYRWRIDNQDYEPISRRSPMGSLDNPFYFPGGGEKAYERIELYITNESSYDIPNTGIGTSDTIPYEGMIIGRFYNTI